MKRTRYLVGAFLLSLLGGCATGPGMFMDESRLKPAEVTPEPAPVEPLLYSITPGLIAQLSQQATGAPQLRDGATSEDLSAYEYHVGPGDVLTITVWDHPELTIPAGEFRSPDAAGHLVNSKGIIFYPYVGDVMVAGKTTPEIRAELTERIKQYIQNPQLDVRVAAFRSQNVFVTGEVKQPNLLSLNDRPTTVVQAVNLSGGATPEADLSNVILTRDGVASRLDLLALYRGENPANLLLRDGDQIYVPNRADNQVFILGEVASPSARPMRNGKMSLAEAIGVSQGLDPQSADPSRVFVIRGDLQQPVVYQLDARQPDALLMSTMFQLQPRDIVYVAVNDLSRWNRVLSQLVPTVQALYQTEVLLRRW